MTDNSSTIQGDSDHLSITDPIKDDNVEGSILKIEINLDRSSQFPRAQFSIRDQGNVIANWVPDVK